MRGLREAVSRYRSKSVPAPVAVISTFGFVGSSMRKLRRMSPILNRAQAGETGNRPRVVNDPMMNSELGITRDGGWAYAVLPEPGAVPISAAEYANATSSLARCGNVRSRKVGMRTSSDHRKV